MGLNFTVSAQLQPSLASRQARRNPTYFSLSESSAHRQLRFHTAAAQGTPGNHRLWLEPSGPKPRAITHVELESSKPCCPAPVASGLSGLPLLSTLPAPQPAKFFLPHLKGVLPLASFPSLCRKAHTQWPGPARGEHLLRTPVALGLNYSTQVPPTTSILEGLGPATHLFPARVPSGGSSFTAEGKTLFQSKKIRQP